MSCNHRCNQGRACTCSPQSLIVNLVAGLIWVVALLSLCAVLYGVIE